MPLQNRPINMGEEPIRGLADGVADSDAVNVGQMNTAIAAAIPTVHDPVTLAGTPAYITLAGQVLTRLAINLASHVTGVLPVANFTTGTPDGTKYVRDDGVLTTPDLGFKTVVKTTADYSLATQTTYATVAGLSVPLDASSLYIVEFTTFYKAGAGLMYIAVNGPASATLIFGGQSGFYLPASPGFVNRTAYDNDLYLAGASEVSQLRIAGTITTTGAGNLELRVRQNSSNADPILILKGSYAKYKKVT